MLPLTQLYLGGKFKLLVVHIVALPVFVVRCFIDTASPLSLRQVYDQALADFRLHAENRKLAAQAAALEVTRTAERALSHREDNVSPSQALGIRIGLQTCVALL